VVANHRGGGESSVIVTTLLFLTTWTSAMTALWINNPGFDTDHRHRHRGGMLTKTPPPTELQIPATVTTLLNYMLAITIVSHLEKKLLINFILLAGMCYNGRWQQRFHQFLSRHHENKQVADRDKCFLCLRRTAFRNIKQNITKIITV